MENVMTFSAIEKCNENANDGWPNDFPLLRGGWVVCLENVIISMLSCVQSAFHLAQVSNHHFCFERFMFFETHVLLKICTRSCWLAIKMLEIF